MPNFKILIEYDGFNYSGWQSQINAVSVQGQIEKAIHAFSGEKTIIYGAGRTDAGVHALAQCANFQINNKTELYQILHGINFHLSKESIKIIDKVLLSTLTSNALSHLFASKVADVPLKAMSKIPLASTCFIELPS